MSTLRSHIQLRRTRDFELDIALDIEAGETVALLGPNGAGKSSAVAALAGLVSLDYGRVSLAGRVLDDPTTAEFVPPEQRDIGVVFQDYLLFDHLSVVDNVMFGLTSRGIRRTAARATADHWLGAVGLERVATRRPPELSGGQAQRIALARALAIDPKLLLLDEPLAALDVQTRTDLRRVLAEHLGSFAGPRLLITHDPTDAFLLADRIAIIEDGQITQLGTSDEIRRRPATAYVAALAGTNLLAGRNNNGALTLKAHTTSLQTSDTSVSGDVLIAVHPTAIALHLHEPQGSPRNTWQTTVGSIEPLGDTTRITLGDPLPLGVDITPGSTAALGLAPGKPVWASVKATEVHVTSTGSTN